MNGSKMVSAQRMAAVRLIDEVRYGFLAGIERTMKALSNCRSVLDEVTTLDTVMGWRNFADDDDRAYGGVSVKVSTSVPDPFGDYRQNFQIDVQASSTLGPDLSITCIPTVRETRLICAQCFALVTGEMDRLGHQYVATQTAQVGVCESGKCLGQGRRRSADGRTVVEGNGVVISRGWHLLNGTKVPRQTATHDFGEGNDLHARGYLGSQYEVSQPQIIETALAYRLAYTEGRLPHTLTLKAHTQHDSTVKTALAWDRDGLTGKTVKADKRITSLSTI
jgi:hypothetical protein